MCVDLIMTLEEKINAIEIFNDPVINSLIVEGKTDSIIYNKVIEDANLSDIEFDVVIAENKNEVLKFLKKKTDLNFIMILDTDLDRYYNRIIENDRVLYTHYYTLENYLVLPEVIDIASRYFSSRNNPYKDGNTILNYIYTNIHDFVLFYIANNYYGWGISFEKRSVGKYDFHINLKIDKEKLREDFEKCKSEKSISSDFNWDEFDKIYSNLTNSYNVNELFNGKITFDAVYFYFSNKYPTIMCNRNKNIFKADLAKYFINSPEGKEFGCQLKSKMQKYFQVKTAKEIYA